MRSYMLKVNLFACIPILALVVSSCSIEINQPSVAASPIAGTAEQNPSATQSPARKQIPVTWASLNLTGKLIYTAVNSTIATVGVQSLDLATGDLSTIFQTPPGSWMDAVAVSPDSETLVISYSPPMEAPYGGQGSIYGMPLDGSKPPHLLVVPASDQDQYSQPAWSADGKYIYFANTNYRGITSYAVMRVPYPDGKPEKLVDQAYWPRVSEDGTRLTYVSIDPQSLANSLFFANDDGSDAHQVPLNGLPVPYVIDVPMFSTDNELIIFSSPVGIKSSVPNWIDKLLGVTIAFADGSLPSDWWSIPLSGGKPNQLTNVQSLALYGVFSPDKKYIASFSANGIFVMKPDGTEVTMIVNDVGGITGSVSWIP
jgi:hypothetical protein